MLLYYLYVHCSDQEWSSQQGFKLLENLAVQYAAQYGDKRPLIVEVIEHGGWYETWFFGPEAPEGRRLWTANDVAPLSEFAQQIQPKYRAAKSEHLGSVRR